MRKNRNQKKSGKNNDRKAGLLKFQSGFIQILFLAFFIIGCGVKEQSGKQLSASGKTRQGDLNIIECKGTIEAEHHFTRYLQQGEKVASLSVKDGDEVKKGDLLVVLSNYALLKEYVELSYRKLQFNEKKNDLKILNLEMAKASRELSDLEKGLDEEKKLGRTLKDYPLEIQSQRINKKIEGLREQLNIMEKKRDFLETSIKEEKKIISFLDSQLTQVNRRSKGMEIRAPFDGMVNYVASSTESLHTGDLVIEVLNQQRLYVRAQVWQHQLQYIEVGNEVKVFPDFFGDYFFRGKVRKISSSYIKTTRDEYPKFSVYIDIDPNIKKIKAGMSVTVTIERSE